jgi:flagellar biosynthesis protein FlhA
VSKAGVRGAAAGALHKQFAHYPKALGMSAAVMAGIGLLPGIPILPFGLLAGGAGWLAYKLDRQNKAKALTEAVSRAAGQAGAAGAARRGVDLGKPEDRRPEDRDRLRAAAARQCRGGQRQAHGADQGAPPPARLELGFIMPSVRILDNVTLDPNTYIIRVKEVEAGTGRVFPGLSMAMDPMGGQVQLPGQHTLEPTFGLPGDLDRRGAARRGVAARLHGRRCLDRDLDPPDGGHQGAHRRAPVACRGAEAPQGPAEGARRPRARARAHPDLDHGHPAGAAASPAERVSIRDLGTILEGIADVVGP